ncbi:hypothetical protein I302_104766 [Kwoniella bestiolae CBS 10118]|uniref:Zn(2)-C6 fungal-type domain-containing protein n=1 Tax=Kwoniella bestiolae CBS 10118 TaxID=1296100 RepID=A0A1B9FRU1_9TREE|nr:hypothetical protein I302_09164 [Kwoniella bestiolae CBS 10118]OCF21485.1 hypothetical protein I302_09164 [Kwoniella bestiolae CBS 10118]
MEHSQYLPGQGQSDLSAESHENEAPRYDYTLPPIHRTESASSSTAYPSLGVHPTQTSSSTNVAGSDKPRPKKRSAPEGSSADRPTAKNKSKKEDDSEHTPRRAAQACLRCRKQKLKCIGGWPCDRCSKSKNVCDFGRPGVTASTSSSANNHNGGNGSEANTRLEQLESSVANLLAGLAGSNGSGGGSRTGYPNHELLHTFDPVKKRQETLQTESGAPYPPHHTSGSQYTQNIPPPTHVKTLDPPRRTISTSSLHNNTIPVASMSPDDLHSSSNPIGMSQNHVRFTSSPNMTFISHNNQSPSGLSSSGTGPSPASANTAGTGVGSVSSADLLKEPLVKKRKGKGQKAEERLAAATEGDFAEPPFKALVYQPSVWDNREQSRRNSPQPSQSTSRDEIPPGTYERRFMNDRDDPVNTELVDLQMAETLFGFFIDHCHPFLPIVNVALDDAFNTIRQSPFLISAIIAVAARFYIKFTSRSPGAMPSLDQSVPPRLANLAEAHLSNTLLRKQHALSDVQAVLLLSAWGLQSGGRGPDAWVVTGHAARIARRLGVHKLLGQAAEIARLTRPDTIEWQRLEQFMPQWRTWLCWFCFDGFLSLGFGRPQSTQFETVDEQGFLQIRLSQSLPRPGSTPSISLYGDVYIAGQVQLTQIGRDLINWGEMLADPRSALWADPKRADMFHDKELNVRTMFKDLNKRLDDWSKLWVWSGSPYTLYLGSSARIARLQADHMRLCLNSFALKSGPEEDEVVAQCLKKALNAAMSTIQTHHESSQTDLALSFATDYLTITLAQSAVFLVRIARSSPAVLQIVNIELSVISYYLKMSIELLEAGELSETRLSTYLSKTIRDIARAAEITGIGFGNAGSRFGGGVSREGSHDGIESRPHSSHASGGVPLPLSSNTGLDDPSNDLAAFEMESFLQFENQLDLGYLLGLPGDGSALIPNSQQTSAGYNGTATPTNNNNSSFNDLLSTPSNLGQSSGIPGGFNSEFAFGMNGIGNFDFGLGGGWFNDNEENGNGD